MFARVCSIAFSLAFAATAASEASAVETANGLSVNGLSVNGLSTNGVTVNGTENPAALSLKAIILRDDQVLAIER